MLTDYTVVDLETTGLDATTGRITEIAARRYRNGKLSGAMSVLVWAGVAPEPDAVALNGLTADTLERHGITEWQALEMLQRLLGASVLVAHNAAFELAWLNQARLRWQEEEFSQHFLCTKTLALALRAGSGTSYSLKQLAADYGIVWQGASHRAMPDVQATRDLLAALVAENEQRGLAMLSLDYYRNACGQLAGQTYPLPAGLPGHVREVGV